MANPKQKLAVFLIVDGLLLSFCRNGATCGLTKYVNVNNNLYLSYSANDLPWDTM
jgi:hypothetical protein